MLDPNAIPPVEAGEIVARFIFSSSQYRANDTIKPDAFIPQPYQDLSVNRHRDSSETELWQIGDAIALRLQKTHHGLPMYRHKHS